jgi:hypothetical protein
MYVIAVVEIASRWNEVRGTRRLRRAVAPRDPVLR